MKAFSPGLYSTDPDHHRNRIVSSRLNFYERVDRDSSQLSIKYVKQGIENYKVGNHTFSVAPDTYLVVNKGQALETSLRDTNPVLGICFFLDNHFLNDVYLNLLSTDETLLDNPFDIAQKNEFEFCEEVFHSRENSLGKFISSVAGELYTNQSGFNPDPLLYFTLAEKVFELQGVIRTQTIALGTLKTSTRQELYRRIRIATRFIESNYQKDIDVCAIARECSLSESHFLRSFRKIHGTTPYQYVVSRRLAKAIDLLKSKHSVSEAAAITGFADVYSFSKAFKKTYRVSPSQITKRN